MKKVLIGLLALAVAGGSAFAQGWTFQGSVSGGLGLFFLDDEDDPWVAPVTRNNVNGMDTFLRGAFVNENRDAGFDFRIRAVIDTNDRGTGMPAGSDELNLQWAFGWLSFMDNMITVNGGLVDNARFNALDRMFADDSGEGVGLLTIVRPMEGLELGFGGFVREFAVLDTEGAHAEHPRGTFSLRYDMPNLFSVTAGIRNLAWTGSLAYLSFAYTGAPGLHAALTGRFLNLQDFGDIGQLFFSATAGHTGLVPGLGLEGGVTVGMSQVDNSDMNLWFWAAAEYAVTERIVPRLDIHYVTGGRIQRFAGEARANTLHRNAIRDGVTFDEDDQFFQLRPSVQFRVTSAAFLELGALMHFNIGDNSTFISDDNTDIAAYLLVNVTF